ncbi:MAG: class I SAM-dependent methyltransferase [Patescibacteria group bacterium]
MFIDTILARLRKKKVLKYIPENGVVCDIGCGPELKLLLSVRGKISEGWAIDKKTIDQPFSVNIRAVEQDMDENPILPLPDNKFDCLLMMAVLEHMALPKEAIGQAFRVLRPGAILLLTTPAPSAKPILEFLAFRLRMISKEEILDHKHYFSKQELSKILTEIGFSKIEHHYFELGLNQFVVARK